MIFKDSLTVKYLVRLGGGYVHNAGTGLLVYGRDSIQLRSPCICSYPSLAPTRLLACQPPQINVSLSAGPGYFLCFGEGDGRG